MRTTIRILLCLTACLTVLPGCGEGSSEAGPKARRNERGEIERELRGLEERPEPPDTATEPRGPIAAPTIERRASPAPRPVLTATRAPIAPRAAALPPTNATATAPSTRPPSRANAAPAATRPTVAAVHENAASGEAPAPSALELTRVLVAREIASREPVVSPITADAERAYLFVEATNAGPGDAAISVVWIEPDGTRGRPIELTVPVSRRWRTWATTSRAHGRAGSWTVVVSDRAGLELARRAFEVGAPAPDADANSADTSSTGANS